MVKKKKSTHQCRRHGAKWQLAPIFLPGKAREQRSLVDYCPWGCKESDMTEQLSTHTLRIKKVNVKKSQIQELCATCS